MCLFTFNNKSSIKAKIKGIEKFECGHCPECLQKKSRKWALRCCMQAKTTPGVMVTLTYDTYKVINGKLSTIEENPINPNMQLSKRDCQLFIKRLRKHFEPLKIKYLLTAERGKKGRAHYHALLFGVQFGDLIKYKKSDRGNWIYKSKTLTDIWSHGICTVDCINLSAKTARYCTKYCSKDSGANETFMLFSRGIGDEELLKQFNGKSYWIDGREYSIPREIWNKVIEKRYKIKGYSKYVGKIHQYDLEKKMHNKFKLCETKEAKKTVLFWNMVREQDKIKKLPPPPKFRKEETAQRYKIKLERLHEKLRIATNVYNKSIKYPYFAHRAKVWNYGYRQLFYNEKRYNEQQKKREIFQIVRDNDKQYKAYIAYWSEKNRICEFNRPNEEARILALPESKYRSYKAKALQAKIIQHFNKGVKKFAEFRKCYYYDKPNVYRNFIPPRSNCHGFCNNHMTDFRREKPFAPLSRHYRANDTDKCAENKYWNELNKFIAKHIREYREWQITQDIYLGYINSPLQY